MKNFVNKYFITATCIFSILMLQCDKTPAVTCTTYDTDLFIGYYNVSETCQQGFGHGVTFSVINPSTGTSINEVVFTNFLNSGQNVNAYLGCTNDDLSIYFRIPQQNLGSSAFTVVGEGYYYNNSGFQQLLFDLQITEFNQTNFCSYTYSK